MRRTPDGKPDLSAPAPQMADGKPDLGGLWVMNPGPYFGNIATDLKPEDVQPWANALLKQPAAVFGRDDPAQFQCLPQRSQGESLFSLHGESHSNSQSHRDCH
jgi:hypothetical protein